MTEKLDLFIESQRETNSRISRAIEKLADTVGDLEINAAESNSFIRDTKWIVRALVLALMISASSIIWQTVKQDNSVTKTEMILLIEAIRENK